MSGLLNIKVGANQHKKSWEYCKLSGKGVANVYVIGGSHVSPYSVTRVQKAIKDIQPQHVLLELCTERSQLLSPAYYSEEITILPSLLDMALSCPIDMMNLFIFDRTYRKFLHSKALEAVRSQSGGEFVAAAEAARLIEGCQISLIDRLYSITKIREQAVTIPPILQVPADASMHTKFV
mmetsp:Transcript_12312/g.15840  ORF Transcript_12312/g.15840 Transcript_12312/m.15840 type:complete len:179 (+) Transcript_12312:189-725(+)